MALGSVTVNNLNLNQGTPTEVERLFLFTGLAITAGTDKHGKVHAISADTDLDKLLGTEKSELKTQLEAARRNGGQNWFAYALPLNATMNMLEQVDTAVDLVSVEAVVPCDTVTAVKELEDMETKAGEIIQKYQRRVFFLAAYRGVADSESWSEYQAAAKAVTDNVAAERVMIAPLLYPDFQGALAGRLCNRSVTVADSPMRVATGPLKGNFTVRPTDKDGTILSKGVIKDLHDNGRFTVPQWYEDYDGMYCSDGLTLAPATSDYKLIENLRVSDKAARRIYLLAVARVADRRLNSTPASIESNRTYFMRPLRQMSRSTSFAGETFPGEIKQPQDADITINWPEKYKVQVFFKITPYNAPKAIECNILLDLSNN